MSVKTLWQGSWEDAGLVQEPASAESFFNQYVQTARLSNSMSLTPTSADFRHADNISAVAFHPVSLPAQVCLAGGFTQLVVYRFTGPRVSWQGELGDVELAGMLASFGSFFSLLYRVQLAPAGEILARDVVLFMAGGSLLLLASHSPLVPPAAPPPLPDADPLQTLPFAESITLHLVRLSDGVRVGGSHLECELVDLSGRPNSLGVSVHEDLIAVLALRSQAIHLLQVLRGGEEVLAVRSLGAHVHEDDELVLRTAQEAEERWLRERRAEREAGQRTSLNGLPLPLGPLPPPEGAAPPPPLRRSYNGDLVRLAEVPPADGSGPSTMSSLAGAGGVGVGGDGTSQPPSLAGAGLQGSSAGGGSTAGTAAAGAAAPGPPGVAGQGQGQGQSAGGAVGHRTLALPAGSQVPQGAAGIPGTPDVPGGAVDSTGDGSRSGGAAAVRQSPAPVAVLYPPDRARTSGPAPGVVAGADLAAAAAHQAAVRRYVRQQQMDQMSAQGGPSHPPVPSRRAMPATGAGHPGGAAGWSQPQPQPQPQPQRPLLHRQQLGLRPGPPLHAAQQQAQTHTQQPPRPPHRHAHRPAHGQQPYPADPGAQFAVHRQGTAAAGLAAQPHGTGRVLLPPDAGGGAGGGGAAGGCITGIKQRLLAHLHAKCLQAHPSNPRRQQREALALFRHLDTYRSLVMRKVYLMDRGRLLIDLRTPAAADLGSSAFGGGGGGGAGPPGGAPGMPPTQFFLLFDLRTTRVVGFEPSPGDSVIQSYIRDAVAAAVEPWAESLPLWDRYVYDNVISAARGKLRGSGSGGAGGPSGSTGAAAVHVHHSGGGGDSAGPCAAAERASWAGKLMQLMPPVSGSCGLSSSPYLDTSLYNYDERVISPYIRTRPCMEQPVFFRLRNRPDRAAFRLDPGPYEGQIVRDRRLARNVVHLFHPDAPFVLAVFSVFQQSTINVNFRL